MCVSGVRSGVVSCERVCVSCEWASRRSSVVRREAFSFVLRFVWDSEVFVSNFEFEFLFRVCRRNFRVEFRVQVPWIFVSNFEFVFFVSLLYSTSRISLWIRRRIRLLEFRVEFQIRICRRNLSSKFSFRCSIWFLEFRFEFVVEFDFSNFEFSIRLLDSSPLNLMIRNCRRISNSSWSIRLLEFRFEISIRNFDDRQVLELSFSKSYSSFEFLIELFNFRRNCWFLTDVLNYSRTSAFASLSLPRELCARFSCVKY